MKLIFLADLEWKKKQRNSSYTEASYYRWNHGPFAREVFDALDWMDGVEIVGKTEPGYSGVTYSYESGVSTRLRKIELDPEFIDILDRVGLKWHDAPLRELLNYVYRRRVFRNKDFGDPLFG